ncbi:MAG TPA: DHA2 family efflux MFS transporter permease subunit [Gemmatimonadaceae bacterium]|nr:DHA2 family efflux MFS transporter permease subunit [Gemmatimonadaceae bacterium]
MAATIAREIGDATAAEPRAAHADSRQTDRYKHKYLIALTVTLAAMLELIDTSIVNVAIPHMMGNLGATLDEIAWVSTGYIIANVIVIPMSGWLSAWFGRKRYFVGSILLFVIASFFCGAAHSLGMLVFWRVLQGIGGGALLSTAQSTLYESFPPEEAGVGMAIFGMGVMVGPTLGPTLGGWITDNYAWPWIFYINVPLGLFAAFMAFVYMPDAEHQERAERVDYLGIILLAVGIGALQWMLERGERFDWFESRFVTTLAVVSVASLAALVWHELRTREPVIDFRVLRSRQLTAGTLIASVLGVALFGSVFILPIFLQQLHGFSAWQTGKVILPGALASAFTMAVVGRNAQRLDARYTVAAGALLFLLSMWMLSRLTLDAGAHDLFWPLILRGVGLGLIFVPLTNASMAELSVRDLHQGTGLYNLSRQLGGSLGIAIMATLLGRWVRAEKAVLTEHVSMYDPETTARLTMLTRGLMARGTDAITAKSQALAVLDRQIAAQANVLAFSRVYLLSGIILVSALPLLFLFRTGRARGAMGPVH